MESGRYSSSTSIHREGAQKGTAFRVSENEGLLETMNHLTLKLRDEVKKLLNSKHLFFKEKRYMLITTAAAISTNCVRKLERLAASEEEEESEMAEGSESETEETSKKQRRVEGVSAEVKKMREEA
ncbi:hypothetical protein HID58_050421 [Brassica napus]|uniref:Uncharacterized protein n=1 Tax=Brassica napus TaxID=3708 RepID=A0ABQ8A6R9_BRANA|nr:hypothetical protein HID58_050421 [Brassica napus]